MLSLPAVLLMSPLILGLGLWVRLDSNGPALFRQQRVGRAGRPFWLLKLRSMTTGGSGTSVTASGDHRITRAGRFLRRFRLDELPQLWNVVRGDMALVGPRPEVPTFVDLEDPRWRAVLSVRPGLTDPTTLRFVDEEAQLAAIGGDADLAYRETILPLKLESQQEWLRKRSWWSDLFTLCKTVRVLIRS